jgi:hypothetical protein
MRKDNSTVAHDTIYLHFPLLAMVIVGQCALQDMKSEIIIHRVLKIRLIGILNTAPIKGQHSKRICISRHFIHAPIDIHISYHS